jgi:hypothetical protein
MTIGDVFSYAAVTLSILVGAYTVISLLFEYFRGNHHE